MDCSSRVALYLCFRGRAAAADGVSAQARGGGTNGARPVAQGHDRTRGIEKPLYVEPLYVERRMHSGATLPREEAD